MSRLANANKRPKVIKALKRAGFQVRSGGKHQIVVDTNGNFRSTIPGVKELNIYTMRAILKQIGLSEKDYLWFYR